MRPEEAENLIADTYAVKAETLMAEADQATFRRKLALERRCKKLRQALQARMVHATDDPDREQTAPWKQSNFVCEMQAIENELAQERANDKKQAGVELAALTKRMELLEAQLLPQKPENN